MRVHRLLRVAAFCLCIAAFTGKTMAQAVDVYVGGTDNGKATVWKNGTPQYLADKGIINSVVVHNGNVYAAGYENVSGTYVGKVWKNGTELYALSTGESAATSIYVSESGVVYVAGVEIVPGQYVGRVWKDGIVESGYADAYWLSSIFIDGSDIYAAGGTSVGEAAVWKNGTLLYTLCSGVEDAANSLFVFDGDVYTTGREYDDVNNIYPFKVWKNNAALYTSEKDAWGSSIYISEGVIYAVGYQYSENEYIATLWTDGVAAELVGGSEGNSVFVYDGDVYVAGENWDTSKALLWVNGTATTLATNGVAYSVFVVEKSYTITATAGTNGTITPNGEVIVSVGKNQTFTFSANSGYEIEKVLIDGTNDTAAVTAGTYTFENVTADHTISVSFKSITGIAEITSDQFRLYPNPTDGKLLIESGNLCVEKVEIYDIHGRNVLSRTPNLSPETVIDISHLPSGTYFVKLKTATEELTKKVIKE